MSYTWQDARNMAIQSLAQASGDSNVASGINKGPKNQQRLDFKKIVRIGLLKYREETFPIPETTIPTNPSHDV